MQEIKSLPTDFFPILLMFLVAAGFVLTTMFITHLLGPKRKSKIKEQNYECGIPSQGDARLPISVSFFLVAIFFVLFDIEVIFMYPWAVNFDELGGLGLIEMCTFIGTLLLGYFYIIKKKALNWEI